MPPFDEQIGHERPPRPSPPPASASQFVRERSTYLTDDEAEKLCLTFADGLSSGIGYSRVFDILERQGFSSRLVNRLRQSVLHRGELLAQALARYGLLDPSARQLVFVAERQGELPKTFKQLAHIYGQRFRRKRAAASSLVEPLIMVGLGLALANLLGRDIVAFVFSGDLLSHFKAWATDSGIQLLILALISGSTIIGWLNLPVDMRARDVFARLWMRIPWLSASARLFSVSLFCRYLKQSLASGMTVFDGLDLAAKASNNPRFISAVGPASQIIEGGSTLTAAIRVMPSMPPKVIEQIDIGEESGRLEERLSSLTEDYEAQAEVAFQRVATSITWIVRYSVVVGVIGSVFMSVFEMASR